MLQIFAIFPHFGHCMKYYVWNCYGRKLFHSVERLWKSQASSENIPVLSSVSDNTCIKLELNCLSIRDEPLFFTGGGGGGGGGEGIVISRRQEIFSTID